MTRLNSEEEKSREIESLKTELTALRQLVRDQAAGTPRRKWFAGISGIDVMGSVGISLVSIGVACWQWKLGIIVAGVLLIATCLYAARAD